MTSRGGWAMHAWVLPPPTGGGGARSLAGGIGGAVEGKPKRKLPIWCGLDRHVWPQSCMCRSSLRTGTCLILLAFFHHRLMSTSTNPPSRIIKYSCGAKHTRFLLRLLYSMTKWTSLCKRRPLVAFLFPFCGRGRALTAQDSNKPIINLRRLNACVELV